MPVRTSIWIQPTVEARTLKNLRPKREDTVGPLGSPCFTILQGLIWDQTKAGSAILAGSGVSLSKSGDHNCLWYTFLQVPGTGTLHHLVLFAALFGQLVVHLANLPNFTVLSCVTPIRTLPSIHIYVCAGLSVFL